MGPTWATVTRSPPPHFNMITPLRSLTGRRHFPRGCGYPPAAQRWRQPSRSLAVRVASTFPGTPLANRLNHDVVKPAITQSELADAGSAFRREHVPSPRLWSAPQSRNLTHFPVALPFCLAHRFRCASAIFFRAAALSLRRLRAGDAVLSLAAAVEVESRARTVLRRAISSSIAARILSVVMDLNISGA